MRTFGMVLLGLLAGFGLIALVMFVGVIYLVSSFQGVRTPVVATPDKIVLTLDLDRGLVEGSATRRIEGLNLRSYVTLQDAVLAIRKAKDDPRVVAFRAIMNQPALSLARSQDVRDALAEFRAAGKPTYIFSETMGEGDGHLPAYYLAAGFGDIWMQPSGTVGIAGIGTEGIFLRGFLDRFGLKGSFLSKGEYKSAPEMFTNTGMSAPNREETTALLASWFNQMVTGIAADRKLDEKVVRTLIDEGPINAKEAKDKGLIDHIGYRDEFDAALKKEHTGASPMTLARYAGVDVPGAPEASKRIAVIHAIGEIARGGRDDASPFTADTGIWSDRMVRSIRRAAEDAKVDAILLRIDSPGGSYVASDVIWREIVRAKEDKKKPIVVSMGDTAASGGYFIAMPADRIFAQPATVTGSIGVFMGKIVVGGAMEKLDINTERVVFGESAATFSATTDFSPKDVERLNRALDITYADFTTKAAKGRNKTVEEIDKVARGRVWSGADAVGAGLVDELGGFLKALDHTKTRIGLKPEDRVNLVQFSDRPESLFNFLQMLDGDLPDEIAGFMRAMMWLRDVVAPVMNRLEAGTQGPQLYMEPIGVR